MNRATYLKANFLHAIFNTRYTMLYNNDYSNWSIGDELSINLISKIIKEEGANI